MKNYKQKIQVLLCIMCALIFCGCGAQNSTSSVPPASISDGTQEESTCASGGTVKVSFLKTMDDADCIVLQNEEKVIMIDTAEQQDGASIVAWLQKEGIGEIDYLILTHPDKDHIGGAPLLIESVTVKQVIQPLYSGEKERLTVLNNRLQKKDIPVLYPQQTYSFTLGDMAVQIFPPQQASYNGDNNYSLVTLVQHGDVNMLFAGDCEKKRLAELMEQEWPAIDLLKAPYHGRLTGKSIDFINLITPQYAVVTAAQADGEIEAAYQAQGTCLYYSLLGTVDFISDATNITPLQ